MKPEDETFDPDTFSVDDAETALARGVQAFNATRYHEAHEEIEQCWLANESADADFFKGLIQAAICMHHFQRANLEGARKLYSGHRRLLGKYLPNHRGIDVAGFLEAMQDCLRPVLRARAGEDVVFDPEHRPHLSSGDDAAAS